MEFSPQGAVTYCCDYPAVGELGAAGLEAVRENDASRRLRRSLLTGELDAPFRLKDELARIDGQFANVVIDCPPALGLLTVNALVASTHLLIPIQSSYFALEGTDDLLETIEKVRQRPNPGLDILGVVITMHDKRTALARDIQEQIRKVFGDKVFKTVISKSVRLEESPAYRESIFTFAPESTGAAEYYSLSEEVIDRA